MRTIKNVDTHDKKSRSVERRNAFLGGGSSDINEWNSFLARRGKELEEDKRRAGGP